MSTIIIKRHCVSNDPVTQLSTLQQNLLQEPRPVRIADAPTGAGKSYAFQRTMADNAERVLFIVPTRRLAQNLVRGLREDLKQAGWSQDKAQNKVSLWSSDASKQLREAGITRIGPLRVREILSLNYAVEGGEMIVAIPESLNNILLRKFLAEQQSDTGVLDILNNFEHIVFDEFHTIEARGFGLAALFAKLAAEGMGRAKVSFLSATPLEIQPVLEKLGVPTQKIALLRETISDSGRAVHGDVRLSFNECDSMVELAEQHSAAIRQEVEQGQQVVMIYNSLAELQRQIPALEQVVRTTGIDPHACLLINSLDDSRADITNPGAFSAGRNLEPEQFKILIATASVEMGVTFKANLLLMEPGFEPLNFLQRYGRAARGNYQGQVIVRWDDGLRKRFDWLRRLLKWATKHDGKMLEITDLSAELTRKTQKQFKSYPDDQPLYFGKLSNRAAYAAGLYWHVMMRQKGLNQFIKNHLQTHKPIPAKAISQMLAALSALEQDSQFGTAAQSWREGFEQQARVLRDIGKRIRVVEASGEYFEAAETWLQRETKILECCPILLGDKGEEIHLDGSLQDYYRDQKKYTPPMVTIYFPHTQSTAELKDDFELVENWCRELKNPRDMLLQAAWDDYPEAMAAAEKLVRLTGLVVCEDSGVDTTSGVI
ncbi:DEAD/DEAH box helicase [Candidatus Venteria ishoeyi]|uniref:DEAD/DEAH box helicase n=1 Tax=Candidatus Venteria ishoeyi TaxID=1899563 RepID=A0A1H6FAN6_9GAMM|nr:DEAD/DEAH box helicase [Candidatus Venteria ishoeyi]SEH07170.1 DEAD/DEAH box helicase [Candidatus Venteria ishoeyi]